MAAAVVGMMEIGSRYTDLHFDRVSVSVGCHHIDISMIDGVLCTWTIGSADAALYIFLSRFCRIHLRTIFSFQG